MLAIQFDSGNGWRLRGQPQSLRPPDRPPSSRISRRFAPLQSEPGGSMGCLSILFEAGSDRTVLEPSATREAFHDLHIDQIIATATDGRAQYRLEEFLSRPLRSASTISYRQEVMRDFENPILFEKLVQFAERMRSIRAHLTLSDKLYYQPQKDAWRLDAITAYCDAVATLATDLSAADLHSCGLGAFRDYLTNYARSAPFAALDGETRQLQRKLASVRYCVLIRRAPWTCGDMKARPTIQPRSNTISKNSKRETSRISLSNSMSLQR